MPNAEIQFQIAVYSPSTGELLDVISSNRIHSLSYERLLNDVGTFQATLSGDDECTTYADTRHLLMELMRKQVGGTWKAEGVFFNLLFDRFEDENNLEYIVLAGPHVKQILKSRYIRGIDDNENGGLMIPSTKAGAADVVMRDFVYDQCVSPASNTARAFAYLQVAAVDGTGDYVFERVQREQLLPVLQRVAQAGNMDFDIVRASDNVLEFQAGRVGKDRRWTTKRLQGEFTLFTRDNGNIIEPRLTLDYRDEITAVYVMGEGPEEDRDELLREGGNILASPWNRIEGITDARDIERGYVDGLITAGDDYLGEHSVIEELTFKPVIGTPGAEYRIDWDLGDTITVKYKGQYYDRRIMSIKVAINDDEQLEVTLDAVDSITTAATAPAPGQRQIQQNSRDIKRLTTLSEKSEVTGSMRRKPREELYDTTDATLANRWTNGMVMYCTDGRKTGEGAGVGTGVQVYWDNDTEKWLRYSDDTEVQI